MNPILKAILLTFMYALWTILFIFVFPKGLAITLAAALGVLSFVGLVVSLVAPETKLPSWKLKPLMLAVLINLPLILIGLLVPEPGFLAPIGITILANLVIYSRKKGIWD